MKKHVLLSAIFILGSLAFAQNPVIQTCFTTDPAPMVHDDTLYVYTGHDEDNADFFWMQEWRVYSTKDMVNYTDHGSPLALEDFSWADDRAWASQCIYRNGKFYWYICAHSKISHGMAIGVAVSDNPTSGFKDALGKPLFENGSWDHIDPTVFIDDDNQAWLMWGNPRVYYLKLNEDMISYSGTVGQLKMDEKAFGAPVESERDKNKKYKDSYVEGPWLTKRNGKYQLLYAAGGVPEHIAYSVSNNITDGWNYAGEIMPLSNTNSFTNHCGVVDFMGHSYFFYHTGKLPKGGGFGRSVAVEEFTYNKDGSFPKIMPTDEGVKPIANFNPYQKVQAETMAFSSGIKTRQNKKEGVYVSDIHDGDYIKIQSVDFDLASSRKFIVSAASGLRGGKIEVRIDSPKGRRFAELKINGTGGWECFEEFSTSFFGKPDGVHDLYLIFTGRKGPELFNLDCWELRAE
ncbi:MAG: glycoside hydrolase family 43 protein [Treponema sp.]|nr:glycoside hydrolase family 43 protein [Treponema sp.]